MGATVDSILESNIFSNLSWDISGIPIEEELVSKIEKILTHILKEKEIQIGDFDEEKIKKEAQSLSYLIQNLENSVNDTIQKRVVFFGKPSLSPLPPKIEKTQHQSLPKTPEKELSKEEIEQLDKEREEKELQEEQEEKDIKEQDDEDDDEFSLGEYY